MGRPQRNSYPGAYFHVHTRGNNKSRIYGDPLDRVVFLRILERVQVKYEWVVLEWCLMGSHYHFVLGVPEDGLSAGMRELNGGFARWSNRRRERCDHLFGQRFTSTEIVSDAHLLEACRYVVLNPVAAGLCEHPVEWPWSSYRACAGLVEPQPFHARDTTLALLRDFFGRKDMSPFDMYVSFVEAGLAYLRQRRSARPVPGTGTRM